MQKVGFYFTTLQAMVVNRTIADCITVYGIWHVNRYDIPPPQDSKFTLKTLVPCKMSLTKRVVVPKHPVRVGDCFYKKDLLRSGNVGISLKTANTHVKARSLSTLSSSKRTSAYKRQACAWNDMRTHLCFDGSLTPHVFICILKLRWLWT